MLTERSVAAFKIESTSGTAESLTAAEGTHIVYDFNLQPTAEFERRPSQGTFSHHKGVVSARGATCTYKTELKGDGAGGVPTWASVMLPGVRWVNSAGTFSPTSEAPGSNVKTLTIGGYTDGKFRSMFGAAGTCRIVQPAGRLAMLEWTWTGVWAGESDVALIAPTYVTTAPMRFANVTWTIGSWTPIVESLTLDLGNNVVLREDATKAQGFIAAVASSGQPKGSMNPESALVATNDLYGDWLAGTEQAFSLAYDDGTDVITFAGPKCQYSEAPQQGDRNGIVIDEVNFDFNKSAAAGDDEFTIAFSAS